ncbi:disintegrin and metalloproteinase domain-containing protein 10 homolog [Haemaphysalis longicornis]
MTFINYGHYVGHAVSELVLCHEIGHNFGSPHDEPDSSPCVPVKEKGGHYIMFPHASKGNEPNNDRFSKCSIANMTNIIKPMLDGTSKRENCLEGERDALALGNALQKYIG